MDFRMFGPTTKEKWDEKNELLAIVVWQKAYPILQRDYKMKPDIIISKQEVSRESFTDRKCFIRF